MARCAWRTSAVCKFSFQLRLLAIQHSTDWIISSKIRVSLSKETWPVAECFGKAQVSVGTCPTHLRLRSCSAPPRIHNWVKWCFPSVIDHHTYGNDAGWLWWRRPSIRQSSGKNCSGLRRYGAKRSVCSLKGIGNSDSTLLTIKCRNALCWDQLSTCCWWGALEALLYPGGVARGRL